MEAKNDEKEKNHFKQKKQMQKAHGKKKKMSLIEWKLVKRREKE